MVKSNSVKQINEFIEDIECGLFNKINEHIISDTTEKIKCLENIREYIKKLGDEWFWEINKELIRDAFTRYSIKIEANSSSFDDIESRREDAIAFFNTLWQWAQLGVPVDFTEAMKDVISTFEKKNPERFIKTEEAVQQEQQAGAWQIEQPWQVVDPAAQLTGDVAQWKQLLAWV